MEFVELVGKYALTSIILALIVMVLVGIVKLFTKVLYKGESTEKRKAWMSKLYLLLVLVFTIGVVLVYYLIFNYAFDIYNLIKDVALTYSCTQALYPIYRKYGGRTLLLKVLELFKGKNTDSNIDKIIDAIEEIVMLTEEQKEKLKELL